MDARLRTALTAITMTGMYWAVLGVKVLAYHWFGSFISGYHPGDVSRQLVTHVVASVVLGVAIAAVLNDDFWEVAVNWGNARLRRTYTVYVVSKDALERHWVIYGLLKFAACVACGVAGILIMVAFYIVYVGVQVPRAFPTPVYAGAWVYLSIVAVWLIGAVLTPRRGPRTMVLVTRRKPDDELADPDDC